MMQPLTARFRASPFRIYLLAAILALSTIAAYRPATHAGFIWDDDDYVTRNPLLVAPEGLRRIWFSLDSPSQYFPLVYTTFRIERALWGLNPSGYHWVNIALHVANALLLWRLLLRLKIPGAFLAAMIFALHPVHVESVAWITERKNVLMGFFFLLTLLAWVAFGDVDLTTKHRWRFYALALVLYLLALSAKTTACTLPAALLLILWLQKRRIDYRRIFEIVPFLFLGFAMGAITLWWERYHVGTRGALFALGPLDRLLVVSHAVWFYLGKLFWPASLTFIYPRWNILTSDPLAYVWLVASGAFVALIIFARRFVGRSVEVAAAFFVATLAPLLGFIMLYTFRYTFVADHYQYLASIGPIALVAAGLARLADRSERIRRLTWCVGVFIVGTLGILTWRQSETYRDIETLWRTTIARDPSCWMAYNNLGIALAEKGKFEEAIPDYQRSLEMHSDYPQAHYNLANALLQKGDVDAAIAHAQEAVKLQTNDADAHISLGNAFLAKARLVDAIAEYSRALELRPDHADAHYNLGNALFKRGDLDAATTHYQQALALQPSLMEAHIGLGDVLLQKKSEGDAIAHYQVALRLAPTSSWAQNSLAWALASSGDTSLRDGMKAVALAEEACRSSPNEDAVILRTLAAAYAETHQFDKAIATAQRALQLATDRGQADLAEDLRREIGLYETKSAFR